MPEDSVSMPSSETLLIAQLRKELATATMERDILKNLPTGFAHLWKEKVMVRPDLSATVGSRLS